MKAAPEPIYRQAEWPNGIKYTDIKPWDMKIELKNPPNIAKIMRVFPMAGQPGVLFCYGGAIYNPSGVIIPQQLLAHECVHSVQQEMMGVERWWEVYLDTPKFRLAMELDAHRVEYQHYQSQGLGRAFRRRYLAYEAERLSGPLYNHMLKKDRAKRLIEQLED